MKFAVLPRRFVQYVLILWGAGLISGCVSLFPGESAATPVWYELQDPGARAVHAAGELPAQGEKSKVQANTRTLLIGPVASNAFYDGNMLAFSADGRTRAYYQFAAWTERPAKRLGNLVEKRLIEQGKFASVAQSTSGIRGELLLNLRLEECFHDASTTPGQAHLSFTAELVDWRSRTLVARHRFEGGAPVLEPNAAAAASALSQALGTQLDALVAWVESSAASLPER